MKKIALIATIFFAACSAKEVKWDATGVFEATEITVSSEGTGRIMQLDVVEGTKLVQGQQVGYIDTVQLSLTRLQLMASRSGALSLSSDIAKQIAATQRQIEWQRSEEMRYKGLLAQNAANQKQVDDISNQIAVLEKQLAAQRSTLENSNRSITDQAGAIDIQIAQIEDQLRKSRITSPIDGTVLVKFAEAGEFAATGRPLFTMADIANMYLRAYVTADMLTKMKLGQQVKVYSDFGDKEQREYAGTITWISDKAEFTPKNIQTRDERANMVYAVKITVANDGYLKIGMYGQVML